MHKILKFDPKIAKSTPIHHFSKQRMKSIVMWLRREWSARRSTSYKQTKKFFIFSNSSKLHVYIMKDIMKKLKRATPILKQELLGNQGKSIHRLQRLL